MSITMLSLNDNISVLNETEIDQSPTKKVGNKFKINPFLLRPESPRTKQAMKELGLVPKDLKQKTKEDLKNEGIPDDVLEWRFNQYNAKVAKNIKELLDVRKRIVKEVPKLTHEISHNEKSPNPLLDTRSLSMPKVTSLEIDTPNILKESKSKKNIKPTLSLTSSPMLKDASRTVLNDHIFHAKTSNHIKTSYDMFEGKSTGDFYLGSSRDNSAIEAEIARQLKELNDIKGKKQKEILNAIESELKRIEALNELKERDVKNALKEKKQKQELIKKFHDKHYRYEEKIQKLKEIEERNIRKQLRIEAEMLKKFDNNQKKYQEEQREKRKLLIAQEQKQKQKRQEIIERRTFKELLIDSQIEQIKTKLSQKLTESQAKYEQTMTKKLTEIQRDLERASENTKKMKEKLDENDAVQVNKILSKMDEREEHLKKWQKELQKSYAQRKKEAEEREKRILENYKGEIKNHNIKTKEFEDKFKKSMDNMMQIKEEEEKNLKRKQEINKLKTLEILENHKRYHRKLEYEQEKLLEKEKTETEKLNDLKSQRELLLKTRTEMAIQKKMEKERLNSSLSLIGKLVNSHDPLKALRKVLKEDDIKVIKEKIPKNLSADHKIQKEISSESLKHSQLKIA